MPTYVVASVELEQTKIQLGATRESIMVKFEGKEGHLSVCWIADLADTALQYANVRSQIHLFKWKIQKMEMVEIQRKIS